MTRPSNVELATPLAFELYAHWLIFAVPEARSANPTRGQGDSGT